MEALLKKIRKIEIKTRRLTRNIFSGGYHSAFKGRGMAFSEVRPYHFGDDVRNIDWNVTARTGDPHVKIFEEERELTVMLLVDASGSAFFGSADQGKQELITEICALLAISADANNDKVGLLIFAERPLLFVPPQKGRHNILRIIREVLNMQPSERGTDLASALHYARNVLKKSSVCFLLSDFWDNGYEPSLRALARRHDCIGIHCWDERERALPDVGLLRARDAETGSLCWLDTGDPQLRRAYAQRFEENRNKASAAFRSAGAELLSFRTKEPYSGILFHFFEKRAKR
jgi:uncharacterized protein (DUF58 family)